MLHFFRFASVTLAFVAMALAADAQTTPAPAPLTPPAENAPENPLVTARVKQEFLAWQRGRIDRSTYSPNAGGINSPPLVSVVSPDLVAVGAPQSVTYRSASLLLGDLVYRYDVTGTSGVISVLYSLDERGKTDGIVFTPQIFRNPSP